MSKKKNTLKDLDEFLKQQAATLVAPTQLSEKIEEPAAPVKKTKEEAPAIAAKISSEKIVQDLNSLARQEGPAFRKKLYDIIIESVESQPQSSAEDKMLINTALYLKGGDQWKDAIRSYWKNKS